MPNDEELRAILNELDETRKENERLKTFITALQSGLADAAAQFPDHPKTQASIVSLSKMIDEAMQQAKI